MILIVDSIGGWSLYDSSSLKVVRSGQGAPRVLSKSVTRMGLIVSNLPDGSELISYDGSADTLKESEAKMAGSLQSKFKIPLFLISDSAFFRSLPVSSFSYLVKGSPKRTGLAGLTHNYLLNKAALIIGRAPSEVSLITLHLDSFSTAAAIKDGIAIETSSGLSYLEGLPGARTPGSIDTDFVLNLIKETSFKKAEKLLTQNSGLLGYSGLQGDLQKVLSSPRLRSLPQFQLALRIYLHRVIFYLGAYMALLGKVDAIVLSGVVGEKSIFVREGLAQASANFRYSSILTIPAKPRDLAAEILRRLP